MSYDDSARLDRLEHSMRQLEATLLEILDELRLLRSEQPQRAHRAPFMGSIPTPSGIGR